MLSFLVLFLMLFLVFVAILGSLLMGGGPFGVTFLATAIPPFDTMLIVPSPTFAESLRVPLARAMPAPPAFFVPPTNLEARWCLRLRLEGELSGLKERATGPLARTMPSPAAFSLSGLKERETGLDLDADASVNEVRSGLLQRAGRVTKEEVFVELEKSWRRA